MSQHYANIEKSPRLKRLLAYLKRQGKWGATSLHLAEYLSTPCIATDISELRRNGYYIVCEYLRTTAAGRRVYLYTLKEEK
jgi:hypothetical protein